MVMNTKFKEIEINFTEIESLEDMHILLKEKFGFPEFYGKNVNALIDCLSSLRYPDDGMTLVNLELNEILYLKIKGLSNKSDLIINNFLISIESVNERYTLLEQM